MLLEASSEQTNTIQQHVLNVTKSICFVFVNIWGFPTTTFRRIRAVGTRMTRRIDPRIPEAPNS